MNVRRSQLEVAFIAGALLLAACGTPEQQQQQDPPSPQGPRAISGIAAVGAPIVGGTVRAKCANGGLTPETATTGDDGAWHGELASDATPCVLRVEGGTRGEGGAANTEQLYGFATGSGAVTAHLTPLTTLIVAHAVQAATGSDDLAAWFADPTELSAVAAGLGAAQTALGDALRTAGFKVPEPFEPLSGTFSASAADPYDQLLESLAAAIQADPVLSSLADLQKRFLDGASMPQPTAKPGDDTVPGTVHAALVKSYTLVFRQEGGAGCGSLCGYVNDQQVAVTVGSDGSLTVEGKKLTGAFHRKLAGTPHLPEIIWKDGALEYALSDNATGSFNEINLGDASAAQNGVPKFLGQFVSASSPGPELITRFAGTYSVTHQYKGPAPAWTSFSIGTDGSITFVGGKGPNVTPSQIKGVTDRLSCCARVDVALDFDLNGDGSVTGNDRINLYAGADGKLQAIEFPTSSKSQDDFSARVDALAQLPAHDGTAIPTENRIVGRATPTGGSAILVDVSSDDSEGNASFHNLTLTGSASDGTTVQQRWNLRIEGSAAFTVGTDYDCYEYRNGSKTIRIDVKVAAGTGTDYSSQNGGRCRIRFSRLESSGGAFTAVEGTFTAELFGGKRDTAALVVGDGVFRWVK